MEAPGRKIFLPWHIQLRFQLFWLVVALKPNSTVQGKISQKWLSYTSALVRQLAVGMRGEGGVRTLPQKRHISVPKFYHSMQDSCEYGEISHSFTFILKNVILVRRSTDDFRSVSFSWLEEGKFVCKVKQGRLATVTAWSTHGTAFGSHLSIQPHPSQPGPPYIAISW